jgi:hypothetical protein
MTRAVPDTWQTVHRVSELEIPVLVVHSEEDDLFPVAMAARVAEACGTRGQLIVINGLSHNEPYFRPTHEYWGPIVEWVKQRSVEDVTKNLPAARS